MLPTLEMLVYSTVGYSPVIFGQPTLIVAEIITLIIFERDGGNAQKILSVTLRNIRNNEAEVNGI